PHSSPLFPYSTLFRSLQVDPELSGRTELLRQPQRGVRGDCALSVHNLVDLSRRDGDRHGELVLCDPEALHEDLTWVDRFDPVNGSQRSPPPAVRRRSTRSRSATG